MLESFEPHLTLEDGKWRTGSLDIWLKVTSFCNVATVFGQKTSEQPCVNCVDVGCETATTPFFFFFFVGLKQMRANLKNVDCVIEIHDARISFIVA